MKTGKTTLETSGKDDELHSKRVRKMMNYTQNECKISPPRLLTFFRRLFCSAPQRQTSKCERQLPLCLKVKKTEK